MKYPASRKSKPDPASIRMGLLRFGVADLVAAFWRQHFGVNAILASAHLAAKRFGIKIIILFVNLSSFNGTKIIIYRFFLNLSFNETKLQYTCYFTAKNVMASMLFKVSPLNKYELINIFPNATTSATRCGQTNPDKIQPERQHQIATAKQSHPQSGYQKNVFRCHSNGEFLLNKEYNSGGLQV